MQFDPFAETSNAFLSTKEATDTLELAALGFGVAHLSYWYVSYLDGLPDDVTWIATYSPEYMSYYMGKYTPLGDPAFEGSVLGPFVTDWADIRDADATTRAIHAQAPRFNIAKHGFSFPFPDRASGTVLFSANVDCADAQWPARRVALAPQIHLYAHHFPRRARSLVAGAVPDWRSSAA